MDPNSIYLRQTIADLKKEKEDLENAIEKLEQVRSKATNRAKAKPASGAAHKEERTKKRKDRR